VNRYQSTTTSSQSKTNGVHQRVQTANPTVAEQQRNQQLKLKKSETVRGTIDFPKSTSTEKSRIESFINRNIPSNNSSINSQDNHEPLRTSHSYRTKGILNKTIRNFLLN